MGAQSVQTPDIRQHPTIGLFTFNQKEFFKRTKRIDYEGNTMTLDGGVIGQKKGDKIQNRGIISEIRFHHDLQNVVATAATWTLLDNWIDGLLQAVTIKANNTELVQANGIQLEDLRWIDSTDSDFSDIETKTLSAGVGTKALYFVVCVPLAINRQSNGGAVFAESNDTFLSYRLEFDAASELYTLAGGTTFTWTGTVTPVVTCWSIPYVPTSKGLLAVLPDLRYHAMLLSRRQYETGSGKKRIPFSTAHGSMARMIWRVRVDSTKTWLSPKSTKSVKFRYGQNQGLREQSVKDVMFLNARWYRKVLERGGLSIDFMMENSVRDTVVPDAVLDMEIVHDLGTSSMVAGDYIEVLEQAVIENETWARAQAVDMGAA